VLKEAPLGTGKLMNVAVKDLYRVMEQEHKKNPDLLFVHQKKISGKLEKLAKEARGEK